MSIGTEEESFLYVISWAGTEDIVKIGRSTSPGQRFNQFLTAHPNELMVRCICNESIMSEADLHARHASARKTLEHFDYTEGIRETIEMLNMATSFKPYTIKRTLQQSGVMDDSPAVTALRQELAIPPLRLSPMEKTVAEYTALGATVEESANALNISESAIKSHRASVVSKCCSPNGYAALTKLLFHQVLDINKMTED